MNSFIETLCSAISISTLIWSVGEIHYRIINRA